ncbi:DUF7010 family protein [Thermophagus sp. OGC60D27]|uniref:DUF7010 family protein n=1 Tax=Thermophagus sp. OGC60D27 TaxID=3458415 RepID=UPI0040378B99
MNEVKDAFRLELSLKAKNGLEFIVSGMILWIIITFVWTMNLSGYYKGILTFMVSGLMFPLAYGLSRLLKTQWKIKDNPLHPLGVRLNIAQLFYFPFLIFVMVRIPDYFLMTYAIITGAHLFPYGWFYNETGYSLMAGIISVGSLVLGLNLSADNMYMIGALMVLSFFVLAVWLYLSYRKKVNSQRQE